MLNIAIAEDERQYCEQLKRYLKRYAGEHQLEIDAQVFYTGRELGVQYFPGVTTPTEYQMALPYGYEVLKFFPAEQSGGLAKIKAMSAPFPMFKIMPTGGISLKNLEEYLSCPVIAACGGSYMVKADDIESGNWDAIIDLCRKSREIVDRVRG